MKGMATRGTQLNFGDYGLKSCENAWLTSRQLEAARVTMTRHMKREGKLWIRVFPDKPVSKKPAETRMGKGKGAPELWVAVVRAGKIMFEIGGVSPSIARQALKRATRKLPISTVMVSRDSS